MSSTTSPDLAPPGAGLPLPENLLARLRLAVNCRRGSRESFLAGFRSEREKIWELVTSIDDSKRGQRVLIKRVRGLEDSSRNWSLWMTLDHLRITNGFFAQFMTSLANGQQPSRKTDTASVKPAPEVTIATEEAFQESCDTFEEAVGKIKTLKTEARHVHPWFGPLDAFQWLALSGMHMKIHREQIRRIIAGLQSG